MAGAHVDDGDVEAADIANEVERLLSAIDLLDLESVAERAADSETDKRVAVDYKAVGALAQDCIRSSGVRDGLRTGLGSTWVDPSAAWPIGVRVVR
jgi:hypothetical protein